MKNKLLKNFLVVLTFLIAGSQISYAQQSNYPTGSALRVKEADGSPNVVPVTQLVFPNGSLTRNGTSVTITFSGGSGVTIGTTTITSGTSGRVLYDNAGVVGEMTTSGTGTQLALTAGPTFTGTLAAANMTVGGTLIQTSSNAAAFVVGPNGITNPAFRVKADTASAANGLEVQPTAAGSAVTLQTISSATNEPLIISSKGTGYVQVQSLPASQVGNVSLYAGSSGSIDIGGAWASFAGTRLALSNGYQIGWTTGGASISGNSISTGLAKAAVGVVRVTDGSTGAGSFIVGTSSHAVGTSGASVLVVGNGTAPSSSPANETQLYAIATATNKSNLFARSESGAIARLTDTVARVSTQFDKTNTTLADITGLSFDVEAGTSYSFEGALFLSADATGGGKFAMNGTATATAIRYYIHEVCDATNLNSITSTQTALGGSAGQAGCVAGLVRINGTITVNAAGTLTAQFAQNAATGTSSVMVGSYLKLHQN